MSKLYKELPYINNKQRVDSGKMDKRLIRTLHKFNNQIVNKQWNG